MASEIAESRGKLDAALRYVDRALEAFGKRDDGAVVAARALRARVLFRADRAEEAWAELEPLRPALTLYPDAPAYISSALAVGGRTRDAEEWLSEAVQSVLAERAKEQVADPASADEAGLLFFLLQQRHRVRHALGLPHDTHDNLAERLETRLANASAKAGADDDLLFWPEAEFAKAQSGDATWDDHRARLETALARSGRTGVGLFRGSVAGLKGFAGVGGDPADPETRAGYARQLAAMPAQITWPPERNAACWCGSGSKYKKCCLPRGR